MQIARLEKCISGGISFSCLGDYAICAASCEIPADDSVNRDPLEMEFWAGKVTAINDSDRVSASRDDFEIVARDRWV